MPPPAAHPLYLALCAHDTSRHEPYGDIFRTALNAAPLSDLRMALNEDQPIGNSRFYAQIEPMIEQRCELRQRGRPRKKNQNESLADTGRQQPPLRTN